MSFSTISFKLRYRSAFDTKYTTRLNQKYHFYVVLNKKTGTCKLRITIMGRNQNLTQWNGGADVIEKNNNSDCIGLQQTGQLTESSNLNSLSSKQ